MKERVTTNTQIARRLDELANLLEAQGANPFRVNAYRWGVVGYFDTLA